MPEQPQPQAEPMPLLAPVQILMEGLGVIFGSTQSMVQSAANMGAQNLQEFNQNVQRGQAQFVSGLNQQLSSMGDVAKKPLVDASKVATVGGALPQAPPPVGTTFSPIEDPSPAVRQGGEQYYPLTMDQSNFREGGFTESPRNTSDPVQQKKRETLIL